MGLLMGIHMGKGEILHSSQNYYPIKLNSLLIRPLNTDDCLLKNKKIISINLFEINIWYQVHSLALCRVNIEAVFCC